MPENKRDAVIQVVVTSEFKAQFAAAASREYTNTSNLARRIITEWLDNQEGVTK